MSLKSILILLLLRRCLCTSDKTADIVVCKYRIRDHRKAVDNKNVCAGLEGFSQVLNPGSFLKRNCFLVNFYHFMNKTIARIKTNIFSRLKKNLLVKIVYTNCSCSAIIKRIIKTSENIHNSCSAEQFSATLPK